MNTKTSNEQKETFNLVNYKAIVDGFTMIQMAEGQKKKLAEGISEQKLKAYCMLIATFNTEKLTKNTKKAGQVRKYLEDNGITPASAKRYMEIGQESRKHFPQTNPEEIRESMREKEITSEAELKKLCFGDNEKPIEEKLQKLASDYIKTYQDEYSKQEMVQDFATACKVAIEEAYKEIEKKKVVKTQTKTDDTKH